MSQAQKWVGQNRINHVEIKINNYNKYSIFHFKSYYKLFEEELVYCCYLA